MMEPGHEIREKYPEKVAVVRHHLRTEFGDPVRETEEVPTDCVLFRTPSGGIVVVPHEVFADYTSDQIKAQLESPGITERIKTLTNGERFMVHCGAPYGDAHA